MTKRTFLTLIPALALTSLAAGPAVAREDAPPPEVLKLVSKMIEAVKAESYDAFLADADANLKTHLSRQQFEGICGLYTQPLKKGYTLEYFGHLKQRGYQVHVWKIVAAGATDDALIKLAVKDGKVGGAWVL
ncbi:MAG TPA: hypothetical protein VHU40_09840 [Polyangia bacterium]|jgi:hypothetical protein|nr:hypothetical protein [Polyangia bacterium]